MLKALTLLTVMNKDGLSVSYPLDSIRCMKSGKVKDFYKADELDGSMKMNDVITVIDFDDNTRSSFGSNWTFCFE